MGIFGSAARAYVAFHSVEAERPDEGRKNLRLTLELGVVKTLATLLLKADGQTASRPIPEYNDRVRTLMTARRAGREAPAP